MVALLYTEAWRNVRRNVGMPLFISLVLLDKVKVVSADNDGPHHLSTVASASKNTTPDGYIASKWALLVNVRAFNCLSRGLEAQANALKIPVPSLTGSLALARLLRAEENLGLLQKRLLSLSIHGGSALEIEPTGGG